MGKLYYTLGRAVTKAVIGLVGPVRVLHGARAMQPGGYLLAPNHISHFDPPLLSVALPCHIDWMAMADLFTNRWGAAFFRAVGAISTSRSRADSAAVRTALVRLRAGHVVGIFPEGGIRAGESSVLQGAPIQPGVATIARLANVPVIPCVVLGTDRLYNWRNWLPFRRACFWVAIGEPLQQRADLPRAQALDRLEREFAAAICALYEELKEVYRLMPDDLPQTPEARQGKLPRLRPVNGAD